MLHHSCRSGLEHFALHSHPCIKYKHVNFLALLKYGKVLR
jgi:hypothetical protein